MKKTQRGPGRLATIALIMALGSVVAFVCGVTYLRFSPRIQQNRQAWSMRHLNEIVGPELYDNDLANDYVMVRDPDLLGDDEERAVYRAYRDGQPVAAIITTEAPKGYAGPIDLLVGIFADGRLAGVRITRHRETPGLGDRVDLDQSDWLLAFDGRALGDPDTDGWQVVRDGGEFNQFTGATITPRAVVLAVRDALIYFSRHRDEIFGAGQSEPQS